MGELSVVSIVQPTTTVSGAFVTFSATVSGVANPVLFYIIDLNGVSHLVGTRQQPVMQDSSGGWLYKVIVNVTDFTSGDGYTFHVAATVNGEVSTADAIIRIDNSGPMVRRR